MKKSRVSEIALLLQEWRWSQLLTEHYMGELKAAAEDLGVPDAEMLEFCTTILKRRIKRKKSE